MEELIKYNSLVETISGYNFNQLFTFFKFSCTLASNSFKVFSLGPYRYIIYVDSKTNLVTCYDLNLNRFISKTSFFLTHFTTIDYYAITRKLNSNTIPHCNEFEFFEPKNLGNVLAKYFKNIPKSYFDHINLNETFKSFLDHPLVHNQVTYNKELDKFSFPLFSDNNFTPCDFIDFDKTGYKKRYGSDFGVWYSKKPASAFLSNAQEEKKFYASVAFSPVTLLSSLRFLQSDQTSEFFLALLSEPFSTFTFLRFYGFFSDQDLPMGKAHSSFFDFEKIHLLYDITSVASLLELFSLLKFVVASFNLVNKDFSLELDSIKYNYIKLYYLKAPKDFKFSDLQDKTDKLNSVFHEKYCGKNNSYYVASEIQSNIDFLKDYCFVASKNSFAKNGDTIYSFTFPAKADFILLFLDFLIKEYLPFFELSNFCGESIFTDYPDIF